MAEHHPLLIFPTYASAKRDPGHGGGKLPHPPGKEKQGQKLGPKFESLQRAFAAEKLAFQEDPQGLAPEFVLVIETRGRIEDFQAAARYIGMDWLGEIDLENLDRDEDFYELDKKTGQPSEKKLDGRLYLAMTNQRAMEELLRLWTLYRGGQSVGSAKWRDLFDYAKDIRRWSARDRLLYSGILDDWADCVADDPLATTSFRLELWYRDGATGLTVENQLRKQIEQSGGEVTVSSRIEDIRFHALKGRLPVSVARKALSVREGEDEYLLPALFRCNEVKLFRPVAQGVATLPQETEAFYGAAPLAVPGNQPPILALLDGYPFGEHNELKGRVEIYDPDDILSRYDAREMRHGTAMASLIVKGELDATEPPLSRKIYCRPLLEPDLVNRNWHGSVAELEHIPETAFAEDRVHRAVVEMFEGEAPTAPSVCIINLSIAEQPFDREISPWARLIDWLAFRYRLLFCVSAGNHGEKLHLGFDAISFADLSDEEKIKTTLGYIGQYQFHRKLLSPGEAINALTVGAQHTDRSSLPFMGSRIDLLPSPEFPSPISRLGPGFRRAIKPEILMPGGRQLYLHHVSESGNYEISTGPQPPGQKVAAPDSTTSGLTNQILHSRGTSNATALASRSAARLYEVLDALKRNTNGNSINRDTTAPLLKALLVHGAIWPDKTVDIVNMAIPSPSRQKKRTVAKFLGYGIADPSRVESCTDQRATVLGCGLLKQDEAHEYRLPLPQELSGVNEWRRLIITLAWLSPINPKHRAYRQAKLSFSPPTNSHLLLDRKQADWQQVQSGTVQHEILESDKVKAFQDGDSLLIKISAQGDTGQLFDEAIPYGLAVTLEAEERSGIPIYERIQEKLSVIVPIRT